MNGTVEICDTTNASGGSQGALLVQGGVTINGDSIGLSVTEGTSRFYKTVTVGSFGQDAGFEEGIMPLADASGLGGKGQSLGSKTRAFAEAHIGRIQIGHYDSSDPQNNGNQHITTRSGELKLDSKSGRVEILKDSTNDELIVKAVTSLNGNTSITGTLSVSSNTTISGALTAGSSSSTHLLNGNLNVTKDITAFHSSDMRMKKNIKPISSALKRVLSISGNTFEWNEQSKKNGEDTGVLAQEIALLNLPGTTTVRDDGTFAVAYEKLVPLLIEAIKELNSKVDALS